MKSNTKNAKGSGTIRKRSDGRWEARYTTGIDPKTGKQTQKSVYGKTQKEVRQKLTEVTAEIDSGTYLEQTKDTVGEWLDTWLKTYALYSVKSYTYDAYERSCNIHIKPALGRIRLSALTAPQIQQFYNSLITEKELSPKTVKNIHGVLHRALGQAVEVGYLRINPSDACKLPRVERQEIRPLDEAQTAAFLNAIHGQPFERLFIVDLLTGLRQGELLGLRWKDVDFDAGTVTVAQQLLKSKEKGGAYFFGSLKNDKTRLLTPAPSVMKALREQRRVQTEWRLKAGEFWEDSGLVFTDELGHHLSHVTVRKHFKKAVESIGIPEARFHDLRHSFAVNSLQAGDNPKTVQENLGHATAAFTLDVYAHATERMKRDSANRMEALFQSTKKAASSL